MAPSGPWDWLIDWLQKLTGGEGSGLMLWLILGGAGLLALIVLLVILRVLWRLLFGRRRATREDWKQGLDEDLGSYPDPPQPPGKRRLTLYHIGVRVRLVVMAPPGKENEFGMEEAEGLIERVLPGLGAIIKRDKPRFRIWPAQISSSGFTNTFYRHVRSPDGDGEPSPWILVAGKAQVGKRPVLLGLALYADELTEHGKVTVDPKEWLDVLRIKSAEELG